MLGAEIEEVEIQPIPPVTVSEAADYLEITSEALRHAIRKGKIEADIFHEPFLIPWAEVLRYKAFQENCPQSIAGRKQGKYTNRLSVAEAAEYAGVNESTIRRWCAKRFIRGARKKNNKFEVPETGLKKFLEERK